MQGVSNATAGIERELRASLSREAALEKELQRLIVQEKPSEQKQAEANAALTKQMDALKQQLTALEMRASNAEQELQVQAPKLCLQSKACINACSTLQLLQIQAGEASST